ncbi:small ribosomal subunit protein cS23-like [Henckelia pumila]|uniref:small ribosomal subunit protein cS23-like n=1 Tax=Henckelia pumila TaxID=405737 RepID=UPI003C6E050E
MLSMSVPSSVKATLICRPPIVSKNPTSAPLKSSFFVKPRAISLHSLAYIDLRASPFRGFRCPHAAAAAAELAPSETVDDVLEPELGQESKKRGEEKSLAKPRLVLKFIWMEKNIGLALNQIIPGHGTVPLSPYFFWPRKDAWEELRATLESKPWISQKKMIILLNQATDVINLWQQSGGNLS